MICVDTFKLHYEEVMDNLKPLINFEVLGVPKEDINMFLPLGMETKVVLRTNLRNSIDTIHQRLCTRAYWEYWKLMNVPVRLNWVYTMPCRLKGWTFYLQMRKKLFWIIWNSTKKQVSVISLDFITVVVYEKR